MNEGTTHRWSLGVLACRMRSKGTMWLLWCGVISAVIVVATQSAARTWLAYCWVTICAVLAIVATIMRTVDQKRQRRWDAGNYD